LHLSSKLHRLRHRRYLDAEAEVPLGRHEYKPPFDKNRYGEPYPQPRVPFVWLRGEGGRCRILSLFCVFGPKEPVRAWTHADDGWTINTPEGEIQVHVNADRLLVRNAADGRAWEAALKAKP